jgi:uncharacterized NAD(P)/FAD-binding protein YdhS
MSQTDSDLPVAIVGAGFSGTLLAINLLRLGRRVVLVERNHRHLAHGLAFGTRRPEHLLNVRAANMSAFPDDLDHFLRWAGFDTTDGANRFVPRATYGRYLRELLVDALASAPDRISVKQQEAVALDQQTGVTTLHLDSGELVPAAEIVLALGNAPPQLFGPFAGLPPSLHYTDPWHPDATDGLAGNEHVLLLGTGLTAIDVAMSLDRAGFAGRITALSRRGLRNRSHAAAGPRTTPVPLPSARGAQLLRRIRARAREVDWRQAIDELRPHTQRLWREHDPAAQARLLRHARPWWDIHRHRLAPEVAERVTAMVGEGRLDFVAGKVLSAHPAGERAHVTFRPRGQDLSREVVVDRIIACTGPSADVGTSGSRLIQSLLASGRIRPDAHRLGIDVDRTARVRNHAGLPQENLFAVGPPTRGEAWEIIAVPDIRLQVWELARALGRNPAENGTAAIT